MTELSVTVIDILISEKRILLSFMLILLALIFVCITDGLCQHLKPLKFSLLKYCMREL